MSMFDNLVLDEFTMLDEGKQADEYRAKKRAERQASKDSEEAYYKNRWKESDPVKSGSKEDKKTSKNYSSTGGQHHVEHRGDDNIHSTAPGSKMNKNNPNYGIKHPIKTTKGIKSDNERYDNVRDLMNDQDPNDKNYYHAKRPMTKYNSHRAQDAANRHYRRHPKTESALMLIAGYDSEFAY